MSITLREASEKVGVTRQTLMKAIKTGRVSGQKSDNGEWRIEPVELFRVWPPVNEVQQPLQPYITGSDTPGLQAENRLLREQVAELREERNAWREQAQRLALTDQRAAPQPTPQRGFWSRLFSRQGDSLSGEEYTMDAPTGPLWSQKQAIAYEVALEAINDVIAGYNAKIALQTTHSAPYTARITWLQIGTVQAVSVHNSQNRCDTGKIQ